MEIVYWYILFAITTSATAVYELYVPVMRALEEANEENTVIEYKYISYFVFIVFTLGLAPLMLFPCIIPSFGERFRIALIKSLS